MHEYRIFETEQFRKDLRSIAKAGHERIAHQLRRSVYPRLREHPHFGPNTRKLKGVVSMIAASHRGSAY